MSLGEEDSPGGLEVGAGLIEVGGGATGAFAGVAAGIEPAAPMPSGCGVGIADALGNRANDYVAALDAPALLPDVGIAAPGEGGHAHHPSRSAVRAAKACGQNMTVVTHEMGFAKKVAPRVIFMDQGEVVQDCPTGDFFNYSNDRSERVRHLLDKVLSH